MLWDEGDSVGYDCDCPVGQGGDFCKHCVATALAWLEQRTPAGKTGKGKGKKKAEKGLTMKDVHAWLLLQEKEFLVDMLVEAADYDDQLSGGLMLKAAAAKGVNLVTYRKVLDQAIDIDGFIDYHDMYEYWHGADFAINGIEELLKTGNAAEVVELSEYALRCLEGAMNNAMDDGEMGMLQRRLEELHLKACHNAKPDPEDLAERLFDWELTGEWGTFWDAGNTHSRVMGKNGIRRYRQLAEAEWDKVKPLQPGEDTRDKYGKRSRITHIMENLALQSGDIEALVAVMSRDLSSSYDFLKIAEVYRKARKGNKALEWAEKGIQLFGEKADSRLQDLLAELYHRQKRHDEAMSLIWLQLAGLREKTHPRDAVMVYRMLIGPIVEHTNNQAYAQAAGLLRRVKQLLANLGEDGEFRQYLAQVRVEYKRKRNFMKLLEKFG
jgi:uncharacterized Zn finger protein